MKLIIANWKCNPKTLAEAKKLFNAVKNTKAVICPPYPYISYMANPKSEIRNPKLGAQNCFWERSGPYTGEVSPQMLKDLGCKYVIIGHSERRIHFKETDEVINKKLKAALKAGLIPILCIGEKKGEKAEIVVANQLNKDLKGIAKKDLNKVIIAYEPVWAISTSGGGYCSSERANEIRKIIERKFSNKIIYGGSVSSKDAKNYLDIGFEGVLVGGESLDAKEFKKIIEKCL